MSLSPDAVRAVSNREAPASAVWRWIGAFLVLALIVIFTMPQTQKIPEDDDYDYIHDMTTKPFWTYVFTTSPGAQFTPVHRTIYAAGLLAFHFNDLPLQWFGLALRITMVGLYIILLRRNGIFTTGGGLLCATAALASVGLMGMFFWALTLSEELCLFALPVALVLIMTDRPPGYGRLITAGVILAAGALSFGMGFLPPIALAVAYTLVAILDKQWPLYGRTIAILWITAGALIAFYYFYANHAVLHSSITGSGNHFIAVAKFFFYGTVVNGALSGLLPGAMPGIIHVAFYGMLLLGTAWLLLSDEPSNVKVLAATLLFTQLIIGTVLAITKWYLGVQYATSFRYIYPNVPFELALLAVLIGVAVRRLSAHDPAWQPRLSLASAAIGATLFVVGIFGAIHGRKQHLIFEAGRKECLDRVVAFQPAGDCITLLYYAKDQDIVRSVWAEMHGR